MTEHGALNEELNAVFGFDTVSHKET